MSLKTLIVTIEEGAEDALKSIGGFLESFALGETQKLVAQVKQTDLGTTALNLIQAVNSHTGTGEEKLQMVVAALVPALTKLQNAGGLSGLVTSIEGFALEFAQSAYNDFKAILLAKFGQS